MPRPSQRSSRLRNSIDPDQSNDSIASRESQYSNLRKLAALPRSPGLATPRRRATSLGPPSITRLAQRTPANSALPRRVPNTVAPAGLGSGKKPVQTTPHGVRALQERRAVGNTPAARARRRSVRRERETPRELLRGLSRILPPTALPVETPAAQPLRSIEDGPKIRFANVAVLRSPPGFRDDEDAPAPPRLSLPLDQLFENDENAPLPEPHMSALDDDTTQRSIEMPRRAQSELMSDRLSRDSFGIRLSGRFPDFSGLESDVDLSTQDLQIQRPVFEDFELGNDTMRQPDEDEIPELEEDDGSLLVPEIMEEMLEDLPEETMVEQPQASSKARTKKVLKLSRHGLAVPNLPAGMIKKLASRALGTRIQIRALSDKNVMKAITEATELFFEQVSDDLSSYAQHAKRKTIDESDLLTLMRRQRQLTSSVTPFMLAQRHLPRELLQDIRRPVPPKACEPGGRSGRLALETLEEEES